MTWDKAEEWERLTRVGYDEFDKQDFRAALNAYLKAEELCSSSSDLMWSIGLTYKELKMPKLAAKYIDKSLSIEPSNGLRRARYAKLLRDLNNIPQAIEQMTMAYDTGYESEYYWTELGNMYIFHAIKFPLDSREREESFASAELAHKTALEKDPANTYSLLGLGLVEWDRMKWDEGLRLVHLSVNVDLAHGKVPIARKNLLSMYLCSGRVAKYLRLLFLNDYSPVALAGSKVKE